MILRKEHFGKLLPFNSSSRIDRLTICIAPLNLIVELLIILYGLLAAHLLLSSTSYITFYYNLWLPWYGTDPLSHAYLSTKSLIVSPGTISSLL